MRDQKEEAEGWSWVPVRSELVEAAAQPDGEGEETYSTNGESIFILFLGDWFCYVPTFFGQQGLGQKAACMRKRQKTIYIHINRISIDVMQLLKI